jgi:hypothetical protein
MTGGGQRCARGSDGRGPEVCARQERGGAAAMGIRRGGSRYADNGGSGRYLQECENTLDYAQELGRLSGPVRKPIKQAFGQPDAQV